MSVAQLTPAITCIVIGAGALHACWNAIAKQAQDRLMTFAWIGTAATVSGSLVLTVTGPPTTAAALFATVSAVIHVGYDLALMNSYRLGSFNLTYPVARGTSPLLVAAGAYLVAGERLSVLSLAGIAALAVGLVSLALPTGRPTVRDAPATGAAVLTGLTIATYTLVDGLGVRRAGDPWSYTALLFLLQGPPLMAVAAIRRPRRVWLDGAVRMRGLLAGGLSVAAYGIVLWSQTRAPLAEVAAIRETSVVFAALIGATVFGEAFGGRRLAAAAMIATGIVLIGL